MKRKLTKTEAKELLTKYHMINTNDGLSLKEGILKVMDRIQSIQYDPLDVVGKNIDLVMQSRIDDYTRNSLEDLLYKERVLIDGWDKMMAVYQTKDFPLLEEVRKVTSETHKQTLSYRNQLEALEIIDQVKAMIKESPKFANEIHLGGTQKHMWGQSKLSSAALDYLFFKGNIGVRSKKNTQKQYDLIENLIGKTSLESPFESKEAFIEYFLLRRIKALGICRNKNGIHLSGPYISAKPIRDEYLEKLLSKALIEEIEIEGFKDRFFIPIEANQLSNQIIDKISFIAPLDNLIWDRAFIDTLFDFKYRWEVYTPVIKRTYGYYVLPILYKSDFIGRIEFESHRNTNKLQIKNIWMDRDSNRDKAFTNALKQFEKYLKINE